MDNKSILESIWDEFQKGQTYKEGIGDKGIHEQAKMNERFLRFCQRKEWLPLQPFWIDMKMILPL